METQINPQDLSPGQAQDMARASSAYIHALVQIIPRIAPHILSGGTVTINTMSGLNLRLGFEPQVGGIITPGGITPVNPNKRIITP